MTGIPNNTPSPKRMDLGKGATIAGSGTGLALVINWVYKLKFGTEIPPDVAIVLAGVLSFVAGRVWVIMAQILKKWGINPEGE